MVWQNHTVSCFSFLIIRRIILSWWLGVAGVARLQRGHRRTERWSEDCMRCGEYNIDVFSLISLGMVFMCELFIMISNDTSIIFTGFKKIEEAQNLPKIVQHLLPGRPCTWLPWMVRLKLCRPCSSTKQILRSSAVVFVSGPFSGFQGMYWYVWYSWERHA